MRLARTDFWWFSIVCAICQETSGEPQYSGSEPSQIRPASFDYTVPGAGPSYYNNQPVGSTARPFGPESLGFISSERTFGQDSPGFPSSERPFGPDSSGFISSERPFGEDFAGFVSSERPTGRNSPGNIGSERQYGQDPTNIINSGGQFGVFGQNPSNFIGSERSFGQNPSGYVDSERPFREELSGYVSSESPAGFGPEAAGFITSERPIGYEGPSSFSQSDYSGLQGGSFGERSSGLDTPDRTTNFGPGESFGERASFGPDLGYGSERTPPFSPGSAFARSERPTTPFRGSSGRALFGPTELPTFGDSGNILDQTVRIGYGPNYFEGFGLERLGQCLPRRPCPKTKYRTIDGTCNNLRNPQWGAANTPYGRLLPPKYADGVHAPPLSVQGKPLPDARVLSRIFLPAARKDDQLWTLATMQWGQIIVHDMSSAVAIMPDPNAPECCGPEGPLYRRLSKGEPCYPIRVPRDDPLFIKYQQRCLDFIRTTTDHQNGCPTAKEAKPVSGVTHWMDGSLVYGSDESTARQLRSYQGGLLRVEVRHNRAWPTTNYNASITCARPPPEQVCYLTGDVRVNQNPQLALLQIILHREHNRVATVLLHLNPHWDDERVYQEARRIVIAEIQHISYYEWLPIFLGMKTALTGLIYKSSGSYVNDYDERINPSVLNEHAQGAFRFLHSNIQGKLLLMSERRYSQGHVRLSEHMLDVSVLEAGAFEDLARGLTTQAQHATDRYHTQEVTENLFRRPENPQVGTDLKSLDVQRGRDHGLASYNDYRVHCGYSRATSFSDFTDLIASDDVQRLANVYLHPDDVDLSVGGAMEGSGPEGPPGLGPTFACIIREQFLRTRVADRFFFERGDHPAAFTPEQLTEIRKSNLARLMCDNGDKIFSMQPKAFDKLSKENPLVPCEEFNSIPTPNLEAWRETRRGKFETQYRPDYKK